MKKIALLLVASLLTFSCSNEPMALNAESATVTNSASSAKAASTASECKWEDYKYDLKVSPDGKVWTYTITKVSTKTSKKLSHFIIGLGNCTTPGLEGATYNDVASARINGDLVDLTTVEGKGTGCEVGTNFIKFPEFIDALSWKIVITFERGFEIADGAKMWIKAGSNCVEKPAEFKLGTDGISIFGAPGCPKTVVRCSYSKGFFFSKGADKNDSSDYWTNGLTIGGIKYTQDQGSIAFYNLKFKNDDTVKAFFQLGAVRLSGVENEVATNAAIIEAYFQGRDISSSAVLLPDEVIINPLTGEKITKKQVQAAGAIIEGYITANHCQ